MSQHTQQVDSGENEWTLILWDIENVPVPKELYDAPGVKTLTGLLKQQFATSRAKHLYSIKLGCHWSEHRSPYSDLLGYLTTLCDVEALSYQWQGRGGDKVHNADRLLKRAADRFARLTERPLRPGVRRLQHLVVFVTSDEDFSEKIADLQSRNFRVEVLYHLPSASRKPVSIINAADKAYDWLPFLKQHLKRQDLTVAYDPTQYYAARQPNAVNQAAQQPSNGRHVQPNAASRLHQAYSSVQPRAATANAARNAQVEVFGLVADDTSIDKKCKKLLALHVSQQAADSAVITILTGSHASFAVVDFSALPNPAQVAADAVRALNGQMWFSNIVTAKLAGAPARPVANVSSNAVAGPSVARSAAAPISAPTMQPQVPIASNAIPVTPSLPTRSSGPARSLVVQYNGQGSSQSADANGSSGSVSSHVLQDNAQGSIRFAEADGNSSSDVRSDVGTSNGPRASPGPVCWGFQNLDGSDEVLPKDDCAAVEQQYQLWQTLDVDSQSESEARWFALPLRGKLCKIDLLKEELKSEDEEQALVGYVWRAEGTSSMLLGTL